MRYDTLHFDIAPEVTTLGLRGAYLALGGLCNRAGDPTFDTLLAEAVPAALAGLGADAARTDPVLAGFRTLHEAAGVPHRKNPSSPENLLRVVQKHGSLPRVNLLVDIYNLVSLETRLALGAHDLAAVAGDIHLRLTDGTEGFVPLGAGEAKAVRPGEYAYVDDANDVLCRLEVRQVEKSKVTLETTEAFYIVQGHAGTDAALLRGAVERLLALTQRFCGGEARLLHAPWAPQG